MEDEECDSDTTVLLEDLDENPEKVARKRHKLERKRARLEQTNNNATKHATDENTAPVCSNNTPIDGLTLEKNKRIESWVNTCLTPFKDTDGRNTRHNENHEDVRDELDVKNELLKLKRRNDDIEQAVDDVISISDDDCDVDEIEHQCTPGERVNQLKHFIDNQVDENKTKARITVLKPSVINARRATLDSFKGNVTELGTPNLESATNEKETKPRMRDSKSSAINNRRATVTCAESNETGCWYEIDRSIHETDVLDKLSAGNVKRPKIILRLLKSKTNEKTPGQNITNEEGNLGDYNRNKDDSTVSSNISRITEESNSNNVLNNLNLHDMPPTSSRHTSEISGNKEACAIENTVMDTNENALNNSTAITLERDKSNPNNENVHTSMRNELDVKKELLKQERDNDNIEQTVDDVSNINGNKQACVSKNVTIDTNENGFEYSTAITLEPEHDKNKSSDNDAGSTTKVLSTNVHETRTAVKRLSTDDNSSTDSKRARNDTNNIPDGVPCSSVVTNAEQIDFTDTEDTTINSLGEDSHKTGEKNENADMILIEKDKSERNNEKYINKGNLHDGTCDERDQADTDEEIERVIKFKVGFCTLIKENLKEKCQDYALEPEKTKEFLKSVNLLESEIEALKTLDNADFKFYCPLCTNVTIFAANNNESNSQNHENRNKKCVLCCGFKLIYKKKIKIYFDIQSSNKDITLTKQPTQNINIERAQENAQTVTTPHKNDNVAISSVSGTAGVTVDKPRNEDTSVMLSTSNNEDSRKRVKSVVTDKRPNAEHSLLNMPATSKNNFNRYNAVGCIPAKDITSSTKDISVKHLSENTVPSLERSPIVETTNLEIPSKSKSNNNKDFNHRGDNTLAKINVLSKMSRERCRSEEISVKVADQYPIEGKSGANIPSTCINTDISRTKARNRRHSEEITLRTGNKRLFNETSYLNLPSKSKTSDDLSHIIANVTNEANVLTEKAGHEHLSESVTSVAECPFVRTSDLNIPLTYKGNDVLKQAVHIEEKRVEITEKRENNQRQGVIVKAADKKHTLELSATNIPSSFKNTDVLNHRHENCPIKVTTSTVVKLASEETSKLMSKNKDPNLRTDSASTKDTSTVTESDRRENESIPVPSVEKLPLVLNMPLKSNNIDDLNGSDDMHLKPNALTLGANDRLQSEEVSVITVNKRPHDETDVNKPSASNKNTNSNIIAGAGIKSKTFTTKVVDIRPSKEASDTRTQKGHIIKSSDLKMTSTSKNADAPKPKNSENSPIKVLTDRNMPSKSKSNDNQNHKIVGVVSEITHSPKRRLDDDESATKRLKTVDINADERNKNENMKTLSNRETKESVATIATASSLSIEKHAAIPNVFLVTTNDSKENQEAIHIKNQPLNGIKNKDQEKDKENSSITKATGETSKINQQDFIGSKLSRTSSTSNQTENSDLTPVNSTNLKRTENGQDSKSKSLNETYHKNDTVDETINEATKVAKASQKASEASESLISNNTNVDREKHESGETQRCRASESEKSDDESAITEDENDAIDDENNDPETNKPNSVLNSLEKLSTRLKTTINSTEDKPVESVPLDSTVKNKHIKRNYKPETRYVCGTCSCIFTYPSRYLDHMKNDHNVNDIKTPENCKILRCPFCHIELNRKSYNLHVKQHHPDKYLEKEKKGNMIINSSKFDTRMDVKDAQEDKPSRIKKKCEFKCLICKETLHSFYAAKIHRKNKHPDLRRKKLYKKRLINAEIGQHDIANSHKQDQSYEVTDSTPYDEGEHETSDCNEEARQDHVEDDNNEASVAIEENGTDEANQRSRDKDEANSDLRDDKNKKQEISNTKSISSDNNNIDSDEKHPSGAKSHISEAHSVIETDHNRTNLSNITNEQESTRESSESEETCIDAIQQDDSDKNLTQSNSTLDYSTDNNENNELFNDKTEKTHNYIYKCKLCNEICNSDYARRMHRKTKHIHMKKKKLFEKILVTDALTCANDVLDVQIESDDDIDECDEENKSGKDGRDNDLRLSCTDSNVDENSSEAHGTKPNQENEHSSDRESEIFKEISTIDANEADSDDEDDANGSNSNVKEQMTEDDYVFKCQECEHTTNIYDNVIQHCQNHYTLQDIHANSLEHSYNEKNIKVIKYTYKSLFKDWDRIFDGIPLYIVEDIKARSIYKTFCVKMKIIEKGSWKHSLYQCGLCATCVPPQEIEFHCQGKCYYISYPCSLAACNMSFTTNTARDEHEKNHADAFRLIAFNNRRDKEFNNTLFEIREKTQREQESIDTQQQHSADTQQQDDNTQQEDNVDTQLELIVSQQEKDSIQLQEHIDNEQETSKSNQKNIEIKQNSFESEQQNNDPQQQDSDTQQQDVDPQQQDVDPQQQDVDPQQQDVDPRQQDVDPQQQDVDPQQQDVDPQQQDLDPQQQDVDPQQQDVDPQQQDVDPQQRDLDPQQQDVDPQQRDVDPQQRDVDPQQQDVDPQQQDVDPQQQDVDPQQQDVDPQQQDVDPQHQDVDPQQQDVDPQQQDVDPQQQDVDPQQQDVDPQQQDVDPQQQDVDPQQQDVDPQHQDVDPQQQDVDPQQQDVDPQQQDVDPQQQDVVPQQQDVDPQQQDVVPQQQDVDPQQQDVDIQQQDVDPHQQDVDRQQQDEDRQQQDVEPEQQDVDPQPQGVDPQQQDVDPHQQDVDRQQQDEDRQQQDVEPQRQDVEPEQEDVDPQQQNIIKTPQADIYKCQCDLCFINSKNFKMHFIDCNSITNSGVQCQKCAVPRLFDADELEKHTALHHGEIKYEFKVHVHSFTVKIELEENTSEMSTDKQASSDTQAEYSDVLFKKELLKEETISLISDDED